MQNLLTQERFDILTLHRSRFVPKGEHALQVQSTEYRQILAPVKRYRLHQALLASSPTIVLIKTQREPGLVDEDQVLRLDRLYGFSERLPLPLIPLCGNTALFLWVIFKRASALAIPPKGMDTPVSSCQASQSR